MKSSAHVPEMAFRSGRFISTARDIAMEVPIAMTYGGSTQAVMMATPGNLEDFACGFTLNEGIVSDIAEILSVNAVQAGGGIDLQIELAGDRSKELKARRRAMAGPVGCGLCGIESIEEALKPVRRLPETELVLSPGDIAAAVEALNDVQPLFHATHAVHGAGFYQPGKGLRLAREDVGRHNALDKLCGAMARDGADTSGGAVVLTSRVSVEMVQKTAMAGAHVLIAISAPTALAVQLADEAGITLIALARGREFEIFSHAGRVAGGVQNDVA